MQQLACQNNYWKAFWNIPNPILTTFTHKQSHPVTGDCLEPAKPQQGAGKKTTTKPSIKCSTQFCLNILKKNDQENVSNQQIIGSLTDFPAY